MDAHLVKSSLESAENFVRTTPVWSRNNQSPLGVQQRLEMGQQPGRRVEMLEDFGTNDDVVIALLAERQVSDCEPEFQIWQWIA